MIISDKIKTAYNFALDIDQDLRKHCKFSLNGYQFQDLLNILSYPDTKNGQVKYYNFLSKLAPDLLIEKITIVSKLITILNVIKKNKQ